MKQLIPAGMICLALVPAFAHESATGIVKERMDTMKSVASATKSIGQTLKGEMALMQRSSGKLLNSSLPEPGSFRHCFPKTVSTSQPKPRQRSGWNGISL